MHGRSKKFARYFLPDKVELALGIAVLWPRFSISNSLMLAMPLTQMGEVPGAPHRIASSTRREVCNGTFLFLQVASDGMSRKVEYDLRQDFLSPSRSHRVFQEHRIGDLMARATNDLAAVRQLAGPMSMYSLQTLLVVVIVLPLMFMINWWLTLLLFTTMPLVSLTVKFFGQQIHVRFEKIQEFSAITPRAPENYRRARVRPMQEVLRLPLQRNESQYAEKNLAVVRIDALKRPLMQF